MYLSDRPERMNFTINSNSSIAYVLIGSKANMTCSAESSPPADFRIGFQGSPTAKAIGRSYIIESVKITDSGIYECSADNGIGLRVTKIVQLIVVGMTIYCILWFALSTIYTFTHTTVDLQVT